MKKFDVWFLFRPLIISALYALECMFLKTNLLILDPRFYPFALITYLIVVIVSGFFDECIQLKIKLFSDLTFIVLFLLTIGIAIYIQCCGLGDGMIASVCITLLLPMLVCFIIWFIRDKKKIETQMDREIFVIKPYSLRFSVRFVILVVLYAILNHVLAFKYFLSAEYYCIFIAMYFIIAVIALFLEKQRAIKLNVAVNCFYAVIILLQSLYMVFRDMLSIKHDEIAIEFGKYDILLSVPLLVCFVAWIVIDVLHGNIISRE